MSDYPDYIAIGVDPSAALAPFVEYHHRVALLPQAMAAACLSAAQGFTGVFIVEPDCIDEVLSGGALLAYLTGQVPVLILARRARDLRPILRRRGSFAQRGYRIEVLP